MRVVITTLLWKRHKLFKIWAKCVSSLGAEVVVAGSEGSKSKKLVESLGFHYIETPNSPLSEKANLRMGKVKELKPDYVLFLGSDDLISKRTYDFLYKKMKLGYDAICNMDLYVYDTLTKTTTYNKEYRGERAGEPKAPGRCYSKNLLNKLNWTLWSDNIECNLDNNLHMRLKELEYTEFCYFLKREKLMIIDIKGKDSITPFDKIPRENYTVIDFNEVSKQIPEAKKLLKL